MPDEAIFEIWSDDRKIDRYWLPPSEERSKLEAEVDEASVKLEELLQRQSESDFARVSREARKRPLFTDTDGCACMARHFSKLKAKNRFSWNG